MPDTIDNTRVAIGSIGFGYPDWQHVFYHDTGSKLREYAQSFDAVEVDTTFHAVPPPERVAQWASETPDNFVFSAKMARDVTHGGDLRSVPARTTTDAWIESLTQLGPKLRSALLQFPAAFTVDRFDELAEYLQGLPNDVPWSIELRHDSWWHGETAALLKEHGVTWVHADEPPALIAHLPPDDPEAAAMYSQRTPVVTASTFYLRMIGRHDQFPDRSRLYLDPERRLSWWVPRIQKIAALDRVELLIIQIGNGYAGHAPACIRRLREMLGFRRTLGASTLFES
ncbi:MAG: DUF72 domain-containing protein [Planctomycetota bacterium]